MMITHSPRFFLLVVVLFIAILTEPILHGAGLAGLVINTVIISLIPLSVLHSTSEKRYGKALIALSAIFLIMIWTDAAIDSTALLAITTLYSIVFYAYILQILFHYLLHLKNVGKETIFAAIAGYLLIGMAWSSLFVTTELLSPGSFSLTASSTDMTYFSFTTLTTVGYGDIVPLSSIAKRFVSVEAVTGVLYCSIIMALIVGGFINQRIVRELRAKKAGKK